MPSKDGITDRVARWVASRKPGEFFTIGAAVDGVNGDGHDPLVAAQVSTSLSRICKYDVGLTRKAQGFYQFNPTGVKVAPPAKVRRIGPRPQDLPNGVTPLSIASNTSNGAVTVAEPTPAPAVPEPTPAAPAPAPYVPPRESVDPKNRVPGTVMLVTILGTLNGSGAFLAQSDGDGRIYSMREVDA